MVTGCISLIYAHKVGVLNEKGVKSYINKNCI